MDKVEKRITVGNGKGWQDVEADESPFDKRNISNILEVKHLDKSENGSCSVDTTYSKGPST